MTGFVLVPEIHTGGWIWQDVADRLRTAGAGAYPVTLTGLGERGTSAGPGTDLETHIGDVVRLIDRAEDAELVVVGHGGGVAAAVGAAARRARRVVRVVCIDAPPARHGEPALSLLADQALRESLSGRGGPGPDDGQVRPPEAGEWHRLGSVDGVPADVLALLHERAVPQPLATLTQPLLLPDGDGFGGLPTTGVLCTANGSGIEMVEAMVRLGDPRLKALVDEQVTFFELGTGHWPMLSCPAELAQVLMRSAAGEGRRLSDAVPSEQPAHLKPFLMDVPERRRERTGRVDLYLPDDGTGAEGPRPAVVFVHGGPVPAEARPAPRDWPAFTGYGRYVACLGAVGATVEHRLHSLGDYARAADDVAEAVALVRDDPRVDGDRVALWFFSGGGLLAADWLAAPPPWLRCLAATYPALAPLPNWGLADTRFNPARTMAEARRPSPPIVLTRVGQDWPQLTATVDEFLTAAGECGADVEIIDVPHAHHAFETIDHTSEAREAVERAVRSVLGRLRE
ncbi:dienelactone hydrolase family protein [Streptomyces sp. NPDC059828]|uniref:dienelactone hydrolase family protein n=1 Tax=Streptomyces sp. NPDC059828 TaxID=3346965 RepID=UPI003669EFBE